MTRVPHQEGAPSQRHVTVKPPREEPRVDRGVRVDPRERGRGERRGAALRRAVLDPVAEPPPPLAAPARGRVAVARRRQRAVRLVVEQAEARLEGKGSIRAVAVAQLRIDGVEMEKRRERSGRDRRRVIAEVETPTFKHDLRLYSMTIAVYSPPPTSKRSVSPTHSNRSIAASAASSGGCSASTWHAMRVSWHVIPCHARVMACCSASTW